MTRPAGEVASVQALATRHNQSEIARLTGIPQPTVSKWLNGKVPTHNGPSSSCNGTCGDVERLPESSYSYLLGLYLGDGSITRHPRNVYKLSIHCDGIYINILDECQAAMSAVLPYNTVMRAKNKDSRCVDVYSYSKHWPCLFPQHGPGMKHLRKIELVSWQQEIVDLHPRQLVRGLIHSDGYRGMNRIAKQGKSYEYPRYQFSNVSQDIKGIFCDALDRLGIEWRVMNRVTISVARREAVAAMDGFVGPKA